MNGAPRASFILSPPGGRIFFWVYYSDFYFVDSYDALLFPSNKAELVGLTA
jgi:hypothetical protein